MDPQPGRYAALVFCAANKRQPEPRSGTATGTCVYCSAMRQQIITWLCLAVVAAPAVGAERIYYTPQRIEAARQNVAQHDWAKRKQDYILTHGQFDPLRDGSFGKAYRGAQAVAAKSDDEVFDLMPPVTIPRRVDHKETTTCPIHGEKIRARSAYVPWRLDFDNHPWKVICPTGGEMYPSEEFPDDGDGIIVGDKRIQVTRFYAHHSYIYNTIPSLRALATAYLLTGEKQYGEKAAVLLAAIAANFPGPKYHSEHCYKHPYKRRSGMVTDYIWECITVPSIALAYDAIKPIYDQSPQVLAYLKSKGLPAETPDAARQFVVDHIFRQAMQALLDTAIQGNPGHHQLAAITMALVLDDFDPAHKPNSADMVEFTYYQGYAPSGWVFSNGVTRVGGGYEGPGYDRIKFDYVEVAKRMEILRKRRPTQLPESRYPNVLAEPKLRGMYEFYLNATLLDAFSPEVGDAGGARLRPGFIPPRFISLYPHFYQDGFRIYRDPRYATALLGVKKEMPRQGQLFEPSIEVEARAAAALPEACVTFSTRLIDDYGFAILRGRKAAALTNYSALKGHYQDDHLALYFYAHEMSLLPDLGYPFGWAHRWQWDANSYGHNTVTVDGAPPLTPPIVPRGWVTLIGAADGVQASVVASDSYNPRYNHHPYDVNKQHKVEGHPPVDRYERATVLIDEDETNAYLIDVFIVEGGKQHDQSWHSVLREVALPDLDWQKQEGGTAAGPDVEFDAEYVNLRGRKLKDGMCYVTGVQRATAAQRAVFDWDHKLSEPAGLRLHVVPVDGPVKLITGNGRSPARPKDWQLPFVFVRREGDEGLKSRFLTILEPYRGNTDPRITDVKVQGDAWPLTVTVQRGDKTDVVTIDAPSSEGGGVYQRGAPSNISIGVRQDDRTVTFGAPVRGVITTLDRKANAITINQPAAALADAQHWVRIHSPSRSSTYRINAIEPIDDTHCRLVLNETSLLGRAKPIGYGDGQIKNGAPLPFATGSVDKDGKFVTGTGRMQGARVENADGSVSLRLAGVNGQQWITGLAGYDLFLEQSMSAAKIQSTFGDANRLDIHDYGVGDAVELVTRK